MKKIDLEELAKLVRLQTSDVAMGAEARISTWDAYGGSQLPVLYVVDNNVTVSVTSAPPELWLEVDDQGATIAVSELVSGMDVAVLAGLIGSILRGEYKRSRGKMVVLGGADSVELSLYPRR